MDANPGAEAMRATAIAIIETWQTDAPWTDKPTLTADEVHELLSGIAEDIRTVTLPEKNS